MSAGLVVVGGGGSSGYTAGGTDVALADGGTGASLVDPDADRILFWDDSAASTAFLAPGTALSITGTTINAVGGVPNIRKSGAYFPVIASAGDSTTPPTKDQVVYIPFPVWDAITIDRISLGVAVAGGATSVVRLGIYSSGSDGRPSALVLDAGTIDGTSATYQEKTISQALSANTLYWAAVCWQVGTVSSGTLRAFGVGAGSGWVTVDTNARDPRTCNYTQNSVTGAFGAATPAAPGLTQSPAVKVRVA